ncbi:hypothetical protein [Streptomyces luteolifulvus]|nr:hypothetical protein [Streptomyces luteolifulvus]
MNVDELFTGDLITGVPAIEDRAARQDAGRRRQQRRSLQQVIQG